MNESSQSPKGLSDGQTQIIASLIKTFGLPTTIFIVLVAFILGFASIEQKQAIIDRYILFRFPEGLVSAAFTCFLLLGSLILTIIYCRLNAKKLKQENNRIGYEKTRLQQKLIDAELNTSD